MAEGNNRKGFHKPLEDDVLSLLIDFAKVRYRKEMQKFTLALTHLEDSKMLEYHEMAVHTALEMVCETRTVSNKHKQDIKKSLDSLLSFYEEINAKKKTSRGPAIGIDLGTTFCCVAVFRNGKTVEIIPSQVGKEKTPSIASFPRCSTKNSEKEDKSSGTDNDTDTDDSDNDEPFFGDAARDLAHENPKGTIFDVKRMLGRKFKDPRLQWDMSFWPFEVIDGDDGHIKVKTPTSLYTPVEITAALLKHLIQCAEDFLRTTVHSAVVSVPVYFNAQQRELTKQACQLANLNVLQLVNEPTAAAIAYNIHRKLSQSEGPKNSVIFDLGGGTFDVAVLTMNANKVQVKAVGGDPHLGGQDIDNNMIDYCIEQFKLKHGIDLNQGRDSNDPQEALKVLNRIRRLKMECEKQKRFLSQTQLVVISLEAMHGTTPLIVPISRAVFNAMNTELFEKCIRVTEQALQDSCISKEDIDEIVVVGGSSRIPRLQEMLSKFFNGKQLCMEINADEAVAAGAAMLAYYAENIEVPNVLFQEPPTTEVLTNFKALNITRGSIKTGSNADSMEILAPDIFDIGVYIDHETFAVGHYNQLVASETSTNLQELLVLSPEIYISQEGIEIGKEAGEHLGRSDGYYNITQLLLSPDTVDNTKLHNFNIHGVPFKLCSHQIIGLFIQRALSAANVRKQEGGKIVITIPFLKTATLVEKIKKALLNLQGFDFRNNIRVLSTLATSAVASVIQSGYYRSSGDDDSEQLYQPKPIKNTFVVDIQRSCFSMGIVLLYPTYIDVSNTTCHSDTIQECREDTFLKAHCKLYDNVPLLPEEAQCLEEIYKRSVDLVLPNSVNMPIQIEIAKILVGGAAKKVIKEMILKLLQEKGFSLNDTFITVTSALEGASLLASSSSNRSTKTLLASDILPPNIQVYDSGWNQWNWTLIFTCNFFGEERKTVLAFDQTFQIPFEKFRMGPRTFCLELDQIHHQSGELFQVCKYKLTVECVHQNNIEKPFFTYFREDNKPIPLEVRAVYDDDSGLSLLVENKSKRVPAKLSMFRELDVSCTKSGCDNGSQNDSGIKRLFHFK